MPLALQPCVCTSRCPAAAMHLRRVHPCMHVFLLRVLQAPPSSHLQVWSNQLSMGADGLSNGKIVRVVQGAADKARIAAFLLAGARGAGDSVVVGDSASDLGALTQVRWDALHWTSPPPCQAGRCMGWVGARNELLWHPAVGMRGGGTVGPC